MPDINVKGRYRIYTHDGIEPLPFTSYSNSLCSIRRPNPNTFITISTYIPGSLSPFTTFDPGSSYTIVTKSNTADFSMGPYTRADRLPSSVTFRSPNFYHGLDKNSITVALSSYALSVNSPLSTVFTYIPNQDGYFVNSISFNTERFKQGLPSLLTHLTPNSSYQFINRTPFTFFAPLQSEMGDAYAWGNNNGAYGMGYYLGSNSYLSAHNLYGVWDKIVVGGLNNITPMRSSSVANAILALSACGNIKKLYVTGANNYGQLGTGDNINRSVWTAISGEWSDIAAGYFSSYALSTNGKLFATGLNTVGQLGITSDTSVLSATTFTQEALHGTWSSIASMFGGNTFLAISANGKLFACGNNSVGQCGIGNLTPKIYTLTKETRDGYYTNAYGVNENSYALSGGRLLGTGRNRYGELGIGTFNGDTIDPKPITTFTPEFSGFTNVVDLFALPSTNSVFIRTLGDKVYGAGRDEDGSSFTTILGIDKYNYNFSSIVTKFQESFRISQVPNKTKIIAVNGYPGQESSKQTVFYTLLHNNGLGIYNTRNHPSQPLATIPNVFNMFGNGPISSYSSSNCTFLLSARNSNLRPTPTPTVTPTPTPSPVPFAPYNTLEVSIFGSTFQSNTNTSSTQSRFYNTPGNLANLFTYEKTNNNNIPPGNSINSTFDYEKTLAFTNIAGISRNSNTLQDPSGRYYAKYLWKRIGSAWTYTLLPASLDGGRYQRSIESGIDTLFITPPKPNSPYSSQGIYSYVFCNIPSSSISYTNTLNIATSYDRGATWSVTPILKNLSNSMYSLLGDTCKSKFSRTRDSYYSIELVGYTGNNSVLPYYGGSTIIDNTIFYVKDSNYYNVETVDGDGNPNILGFDFKHDYYNVPTVASINTSQIRLSRRIGGTWQTNVVLNAIPDVCQGPYYQVPSTLSFYKRAGSPVITMEFDPTNPDLVYIAYLRYSSYFNSFDSPAKINVCCYNMRTNALVFDESVVFAKYESGPYLLRSVTQYIDMPTLYFDTSNNTLNLFFFGPEFFLSSLGSITYKYFKTRRLGTNSWATLTNIFTDTGPGAPGYSGTYMSNSWELKTKY